jgi:hypothetical protein
MESAANTFRDATIYFADIENCRKYKIELRWADGKIIGTISAITIKATHASRVWL